MATTAPLQDNLERLLHPEPIRVGELRRRLGLTQGEFAAAVGRSRRTVVRWQDASDGVHPSGPSGSALRRLARVAFLLGGLTTEAEARRWLRTPNQVMKGEAPIDLITAGRVEEVVGWLAMLADGGSY
jgi:uncharacterized protein (DUF2384 family)